MVDKGEIYGHTGEIYGRYGRDLSQIKVRIMVDKGEIYGR